jgi:hypothetical protein
MIFCFNPSPVVLTITVNHWLLDQPAVASTSPPYDPGYIAVPYGPTGDNPGDYPPSQPHFVPGSNQLFTVYSSLDPSQPTLGMEFTFNFHLETPVEEDLIMFCYRNLLWILSNDGTTLKIVPSEPVLETTSQSQPTVNKHKQQQ